MLIYILVRGEAHEGYQILDVFSSESKAILSSETHIKTSGRKWLETSKNLWQSGNDFLEVMNWTINEGEK